MIAMTAFNVRTVNLKAINSMTKYPSIPTYHALDPRDGGLLGETVPFAGAVIGEADLSQTAEATGLDLTPRLFEMDATELPTDIDKTKAFLDERLPVTLAALDGGAARRAEGIVLRTPARTAIAKVRFQDYERTLKRRGRG